MTVGGGSHQFVAVRGEVQAPRVYLEQSEVDLGVVYVGVKVSRTLQLVNLSNLATRFKLERPGGASAQFALEFDPGSDVLGAKQTREVTVNFTALSSGVVDEILGCRVFGTPRPLGLALKAVSKNAVIAYELLRDGQELPAPLAPRTAAQLPAFAADDATAARLPAAGAVPKLDFGDAVPLFERRTVRVAVRNLSAIAAGFRFAPKKFQASHARTTQRQELDREKADTRRQAKQTQREGVVAVHDSLTTATTATTATTLARRAPGGTGSGATAGSLASSLVSSQAPKRFARSSLAAPRLFSLDNDSFYIYA